MGKLKPCPRCGFPEGLIFCSQCHAEYEKNPWIPKAAAQGQLFTQFGRPQYIPERESDES